MKPVRTTGRKQIYFWGKIGMILLLFFMWDFPAVQAQKNVSSGLPIRFRRV